MNDFYFIYHFKDGFYWFLTDLNPLEKSISWSKDLKDCIREFVKLYPLHSILIVMIIDKYYLPSDNSDLTFEFELEGTNLGRELDCTNRLPQP